ncbi:hypothetical protein PO909_003594 [Leuciscus waleckii]
MNSLMHSQTRSSNKALPTVTTHMISLAGVYFLVLFKRVHPCKTLSTKRTHIRPLICMFFQVFF